MVNEPIYRVVQLEYFYRVAKIDGSKFISNGRNIYDLLIDKYKTKKLNTYS